MGIARAYPEDEGLRHRGVARPGFCGRLTGDGSGAIMSTSVTHASTTPPRTGRRICIVVLAAVGATLALATTWVFARVAQTFARQNAQWGTIETVHADLPLPADATERSRDAAQPGLGSFLCLSGRTQCPYDDRQYRAAALDEGRLRAMLAAVPGATVTGCRTTKRTVWCDATLPSAGNAIEVRLVSGRQYPGSDRKYLLVEANADMGP